MRSMINVNPRSGSELERALAFYREGLGLSTEGIVGTEFDDGVVDVFNRRNDLVMTLYPRPPQVGDTPLAENPSGPRRFSIRHISCSREEVDAVLRQAEEAGARIVDPAQDSGCGQYSGCFQDPAGHLWETAWNPAWEVRE